MPKTNHASSHRAPPTCSACFTFGHRKGSKKCSQYILKKYTCKLCKTYGHMSRNCPLVKNPPPPVVVQNIIPVGEPQEDTIFIDNSINS